MAHKRRRQTNVFECKHAGFGKYCHRCKDEKAGRIKPKKIVIDETTGQTLAAGEAPKKYWKRAKCPFCGGNRVKKNEINAFSPTDTMPLVHWAKLAMATQALISFVIVGLVIARVVNVI